jgi:hypothetical protein
MRLGKTEHTTQICETRKENFVGEIPLKANRWKEQED